MFKLSDKTSVKWPVNVEIPQDGGKTLANRFTVEFRLLDQYEIDALSADTRNDQEFLRGVIIDWEDVADAVGDPLSCSALNITRLTNVPYVRRALLAAFFEAISGAARKN